MSRTLLIGAWIAVLTMAFAMPSHAQGLQVSRQTCSLQVQQRGHGLAVVVFESGFGQDPGVWDKVVSELGAECQCIAYARAGLGESGTDGKPKTIEEHLQDLGAVMDALVPDRKVILGDIPTAGCWPRSSRVCIRTDCRAWCWLIRRP